MNNLSLLTRCCTLQCLIFSFISANDDWKASENSKPPGLISTNTHRESDLLSCNTADKQLLSNLYVDYFQSSGSCLTKDGEILKTFERSKQTDNLSEDEKKIVEEMCQNSPTQCQQDRRSGRLFLGLGKKIAANFQRKINRILNLFTGDMTRRGYYYPTVGSALFDSQSQPHYGPQHLQPQGPLPFGLPSVRPPHANGPPSHGYYPPQSAPLSLYTLLSSFMGNPAPYPPPLPPQNPTRFSNPIRQVYADSPCNGDTCPPSPPGINPSGQNRNKRAVCPIVGDVIFPMVGKSALDNSSISILQDFPHLVQPVFFRKCRSANPTHSEGKCIQEFLPINFFTSKTNQNHQSGGPLLPQEFVLVESGCRIETETLSSSHTIPSTNDQEPIYW